MRERERVSECVCVCFIRVISVPVVIAVTHRWVMKVYHMNKACRNVFQLFFVIIYFK